MYHYNYKITNTQTKEFYIGVRSYECEIENGWIYHKRYKITECAASSSNTSSKSDKNGEPLEVDNPVGSLGSK